MLKVILLTLSLCVSLAAVLSAVASLSHSEVDSSDRRDLPAEILEAETEYEVRQQGIDWEIRRLNFGTLDLPPEERRARMLEGLEALRSTLLEQKARSEAIDALYVQHQVPEDPGPLDVLAVMAPKDAEAAESPEGRSWALDYDLARLRQDLAGNPEGLRAAMLQWNAENAEALWSLRESATPVSASTDQMAPEPMAASRLEVPPDASENLRALVSRQNDLADLSAEYPPPVMDQDGNPPTQHEMEAWRDSVYPASATLLESLSPLLHEFDQETNRRLARQYSDEQTQ